MSVFVDVAFGEQPGRWPLPSPTTPAELWLRAVAAGGQGRYAGAMADLESLLRTAPRGPLLSLAHSARASFLRQLGGHRAARRWDGRAWAVAGSDVSAKVDALTGLAADALGTGRFPLSARLLTHAGDVFAESADVPNRLPLRHAWVSAELSMFTGDGSAAVGHAERAVDLASTLGSARHAWKSRVVLAAALCSTGDLPACRTVADEALQATERLGLVPLSWALACLLVDVGSSERSPAQIAAARDGFADAVRHRGGAWTAR